MQNLVGVLLIFAQFIAGTNAQFGVPHAKKPVIETGAVVAGLGNGEGNGNVERLSEKDALALESMIEVARADAETQTLVEQLKRDMPNEILDLQKLSSEEVLGAMVQTMGDMRGTKYLFSKDKERAVREIHKEGIIKNDQLQEYLDNPDSLEEAMNRALHFQFVSLCIVGELL